MAAFTMTPDGIREIDSDGTIIGGVVLAATPESVVPKAAPAVKAPVAKSTPITPKQVIRLAKQRQREINSEIKRLRSDLKRLEREKIQIDGLVGAASKPLAIVHQLSKRA